MKHSSAAKSLLLAAVVALVACDSGGAFERPLLRVSLADKLTPRVRRLAIAGIDHYCRKRVDLSADGASAALVLVWRTIDLKGERYVLAVEVLPEGTGRVEGVSGLKGSAWVGEPRNLAANDEPYLAAVQVRVGWSARKGCGEVGKSAELELRADDPSCKAPKTPKLLRSLKD